MCNTYLQPRGVSILDGELTTGSLDDGHILAHLAAAWSGKDMLKLDAPRSRLHKVNNIAACFTAYREEGAKVIAIGPEGAVYSFVCTY